MGHESGTVGELMFATRMLEQAVGCGWPEDAQASLWRGGLDRAGLAAWQPWLAAQDRRIQACRAATTGYLQDFVAPAYGQGAADLPPAVRRPLVFSAVSILLGWVLLGLAAVLLVLERFTWAPTDIPWRPSWRHLALVAIVALLPTVVFAVGLLAVPYGLRHGLLSALLELQEFLSHGPFWSGDSRPRAISPGVLAALAVVPLLSLRWLLGWQAQLYALRSHYPVSWPRRRRAFLRFAWRPYLRATVWALCLLALLTCVPAAIGRRVLARSALTCDQQRLAELQRVMGSAERSVPPR